MTLNTFKKAITSKINWTQLVSASAVAMTIFGIDINEEQKTTIIGGIVGFQAMLTMVFRTWFNKPEAE